MPLDEYRAKRRFDATPEPPGGQAADAAAHTLGYVIHKHAARRLHYDLRLEMEGVLRSWAVPKGPSLDPAQKRLAVEVEDHPLEYGTFEGVIPEGEYGAGTVMLWDRGTWEPLGDPLEGHRAGSLKFELRGEKLHGRWALVRMKRREGEPRDNWLLIKERDEWVRTGEDGEVTAALTDSVASGRTMDEIAAGIEAPKDPGVVPGELAGAVLAAPPDRIGPQLATAVSEIPEGDEWIHEIKLDGYRALCRVRDGVVRLFTRSGADWTDRFAALVPALKALGLPDAWLDGEVVVVRPDGRTDFGALQAELSRGAAADITYFAFDLLYLEGYDLRAVALIERKRALRSVVPDTLGGRIRFLDHISGGGRVFHEEACGLALEGSVSKRADAPYRSGRGRDWRKRACLGRQEFVVVGYTEPATRGSGVGALALASLGPSGALAYAGRVGTGWSVREGEALRERLAAIEVGQASVAVTPSAARGVRWVEPRVVVEVSFGEWTSAGVIRKAVWLGIREDKRAEEVGADLPVRPVASTPGTGIRLTHPERVMFAEAGVTKRELAEYYATVGERMLPHLARRPLVLVRCPHGVPGECFYQKDASSGFPKTLATTEVAHDSGTVAYALVSDAAQLRSLVQLGVIEIHTWGCQVDDVERPNRLIFDLDPGPDLPWDRVAEGARLLRDILTRLGLSAFVKTTGGKGVHVVAPILPEETWGPVRDVARAIADVAAETDPARYTTNPLKKHRTGRIFVDYIRNTRGATAVAAFSARARPDATVSVPIGWDELAGLRPHAYDLRATLERLASEPPDPWAAYAEAATSLRGVMRELGLA